MNNIIENDEKILGYKKDLEKQVESEIEKLENERVYIAKACGNVDNDYYNSEKSTLEDLLKTICTFENSDLIIIEKHIMSNFLCRKANVIDSETKEELM